MFTMWTVRLLSMTLLIPQKNDPDYGRDCQPDWLPIGIHIPSFDGLPGMRTTFDTGECLSTHEAMKERYTHRCASASLLSGAAVSFFPLPIIGDIRRIWFNDSTFPYGGHAFNNYLDQNIYVRDPSVFKNCDIVFKFMGNDGKVVDFRCDAQKFLVSPLKINDSFVAPFWEQEPPESFDQPFSVTLGMVSVISVLRKTTAESNFAHMSAISELLLDSYREA